MLHSNVVCFSFDANSNLALRLSKRADSSSVWGPVVSSRQRQRAGVGSGFPKRSRARTSKTCRPSPSPVNVIPEGQDSRDRSSTLHSKETARSPPNAKLGVSSFERRLGCEVTAVSGGGRTTMRRCTVLVQRPFAALVRRLNHHTPGEAS